jgi:hypothetical protein
MNVTDMIAKMGGLQSIAKELGVSEAQAASGAAALVPAIVGGFKKPRDSAGCSASSAAVRCSTTCSRRRRPM